MSPSALRRRVLLSGTMLAAAVGGYGRRAYAACANSGGTTYQCSGANVTEQAINANNASVSTVAGFSVNNPGVGGANAISITGDGALSYTDVNASPLTTTGSRALVVTSGGDFAGTPGSITITTNGALSGRNGGIDARNLGTGAITVTANGKVTGGIYVSNSAAGTNVTVTTGTTVSGYSGISATNYGTGALTVTANGNVTGTGTNGIGITANNFSAGTALRVTTAAGTTVSGGEYGINASNDGTGALTITANGNVSGASGGAGIQARNNHGTYLSVTTGAGTTVSGGNYGITALHYGTGALTITANGNVSGGRYSGILASTYGAGLSVTTAAGTTVSGGTRGIYARNYGLGTLTITANGNVTGASGDGIFARSTGGGPIAITVAATGTVTSANAFAIETVGAPATVSVAGTVAGSMQIAGPGSTLTFLSGAIYKVFVTPATASLANVGGTATLGGAAVTAAWANGSYIARQYTILTAGSVSGTFNPTIANTNLPANFHDTLSYDATHAYLNLALNFAIPGGLNGNQQAVGNALTNYFNTNGTIPVVYGQLGAGGLSQAAGQTGTGSQQTTFNAMGQFINLLGDPFMGRGNGINGATSAPGYAEESDRASAYAPGKRLSAERDAYAMFTKAPLARVYEPRWSVWAAGFGGSQSTDGNAAQGSNNTTSRIFGMAAGADYIFSPRTIAGFALAGGGTSFSVVNSGSGRSDLFQAGGFIRHTVGPAYISAALAYGWQDITTDRTVTIAGIDQLRAHFNANAYSGRVEGGYRLVTPWVGGIGLTPYAAGQFTTFDLPAYAEQAIVGANTFALAYGSKSVTDARSELGLRADKSYAMQNGVLTLRGRFAWAHDFNPDRAIGATFQALPGASFVVNGAAQASNSALTTASAEMKWLNGWSAAATFEGEFSNVTRSYAGKGVVRYTW